MPRSAESLTTHLDYLHELKTDHLDALHLDALIGSNDAPAGVEPDGQALA